MKGSLVQAKVKVTAVAAAALSLVEEYVFDGSMPAAVDNLAMPAAIGVLTLAIGWVTKHTPSDLIQIEQQKAKRQ